MVTLSPQAVDSPYPTRLITMVAKKKYNTEEERLDAQRRRSREWVANKRKDESFKQEERSRSKEYSSTKRLNRTSEEIEKDKEYQHNWYVNWYANLSAESKSLRVERKKELRAASGVYSVCGRCNLWRQIEHTCIAVRVKTVKPIYDKVEVLERWPYGFISEWPMSVVNKYISYGIPEEIRADIGQELCYRLICEEIKEEDILEELKKARSKAYGPWVKSLEAPVGTDGFSLMDTLVAPDDEYDI